MKVTIFYIFLVFTILSCTNTDQVQDTVKDALIKKTLQNKSFDIVKNQQGKLIILKNDYCENFDCVNYFKGYESEVIFYGKEDLFMRGIRNYVKFSDINESQKYIDLLKVTEWEGRGIRIQL